MRHGKPHKERKIQFQMLVAAMILTPENKTIQYHEHKRQFFWVILFCKLKTLMRGNFYTRMKDWDMFYCQMFADQTVIKNQVQKCLHSSV